MPDQAKKTQSGQNSSNESSQQNQQPVVMDAIRHVGPTLESEGVFIPSDELPENRIADEAQTEAVDIRAATQDQYDREADALNAEPLLTRLPGDTSSDPHTDLGPGNAAGLDSDRNEAA